MSPREVQPIPKPSPRPKAPRRRLRFQSPKRRGERAVRAAVVEAAAERDGGCIGPRYGLTGACWGPLDGHEVKTRGRGGSHLELTNVVTICRKHHDWIDLNPDDAHDLGLVLHSWEDAS